MSKPFPASAHDQVIADRITHMIACHPDLRGVDKSTITATTRFTDHLGADALTLIDLSLEIEDEFRIAFGQDEFEFVTVGELIAAVEQKLADKLPRAAVG